MEKIRLDILLTERGLMESRSAAQRYIMAGQVRVNGEVVSKPSIKFADDVNLSVDTGPRFVSRGGEKIDAALTSFGMTNLGGVVCADIGASTGGFTDCLLQHGAGKVYAIDVGYGVLDWKIRNDARVVVMERTNARYVVSLQETVQLVTIDASFISLGILLPVIRAWFGSQNGKIIALIKPQFEAGREVVAHGKGVIRDPAVHRDVLISVLTMAQDQGFSLQGLIQSPLLGPKGNKEFLVLLSYPHKGVTTNPNDLVDSVLLNEN